MGSKHKTDTVSAVDEEQVVSPVVFVMIIMILMIVTITAAIHTPLRPPPLPTTTITIVAANITMVMNNIYYSHSAEGIDELDVDVNGIGEASDMDKRLTIDGNADMQCYGSSITITR
ncbi:hypothetical protein O3M35_006932 [Rhynocoris fuscipes]|uniref:Uncharacterized protein n=1 Tax=Rhynocoris fuscipes TaxID=488301 RepID=A0AAW1DHP2_9HEMI